MSNFSFSNALQVWFFAIIACALVPSVGGYGPQFNFFVSLLPLYATFGGAGLLFKGISERVFSYD